jgi:formylmethanofuran dehydrogenase subunit E
MPESKKHSGTDRDRPHIKPFSATVRFHGHVCPGLVLGYRASARALKELSSGKSADEELVAIVENDTCAVDAIQTVTGCSLGKGNLIYRDLGKQAYTFACRDSGKAVRIAINPEFQIRDIDPVYWDLRGKVLFGEPTDRERKEVDRRSAGVFKKMLEMPDKELLIVTRVKIDIPEHAHRFKSIKCAGCGELVAEHRARVKDGQIVCIPCAGEYSRGW